MPLELTPQVRNLIDATNRGDTEAFLATFTPYQGVVDDWGRKFYGPKDIRRWSDAEFIGDGVTVRVVHFYLSDEAEEVVIADVNRKGFNGPSTFTFRVTDDKVAEMRLTA